MTGLLWLAVGLGALLSWASGFAFALWMVARADRIDERLAETDAFARATGLRAAADLTDPDAKRAAFQAQAEADLQDYGYTPDEIKRIGDDRHRIAHLDGQQLAGPFTVAVVGEQDVDLWTLTCVRRGGHSFKVGAARCLYCNAERPDPDHARATARRAAATRPPADTHPQNGTHT